VTPTDDQLDATSRALLRKVDDLRETEKRKRETARSSREFHGLAERAEAISREVFATAQAERVEGREDSPIPAERDEQYPGDWTDEAERR
jgi:hypothetical protein